ncbi:MAG TPA: GNAT family N-acetyltransferase [Spirochaetota bacterium]|jgi:amino-acid N-acetyltransferase|nr:GNAT family N-acetyltransferase [Spirochaetota bacterium]
MEKIVRKATLLDVDNIYSLIEFYANQGVILKREKQEIEKGIDNFFVAEVDGEFAGAVTFYDYGPSLKEVRSLAVCEKYHGCRVGTMLLKNLVETLKSQGESRIFTLTYKPKFFEKNGFIVVPKEIFPEKIWKDCQNCPDKDSCGETALIYKDH